jgi:hypothetical protein
MFNPALPIVAEKVEAQGVLGRLVGFEQTQLEALPPVVVHEALENRILNALPMVETGLRDVAETLSSILVRGRYVIGDQHEHVAPLSSVVKDRTSRRYFQTKGGYSARSPRR